MEKPIPYVNHSDLSKNISGVVRLVAKVTKLESDKGVAEVEAADGKKVIVRLSEDNSYGNQTSVVAILGTVNDDLTISELASEDWGNSFNLNQFNRLISLMKASPEIF